MKIYLDNNLGVTNVEQEELTQDTIGYNILKVYIPNAVLTPYDTFTCYYGAVLQNGRKVGWFAMEARTSSDADYEANYTLYKATLEQCVVSVEGKVYIGCQVLLGNSGNATLIKKNTAVVQFNVRKSVAINNDILVLDPDQTNTDVLESYKNLLENALLTYATKATTYTKTEVDGKLDLKADKSNTYTKTEVNEEATRIYTYIDQVDASLNTRASHLEDRTLDLENDVENLKSVQNVVEVVATKSALNSYDTTKLEANDKVQVIADETHDGASTIYNWDGTQWQYVGAYGTNSAPKATAITHSGNQLKDYSGNNIYPNLADGVYDNFLNSLYSTLERKRYNNYSFVSVYYAVSLTTPTMFTYDVALKCNSGFKFKVHYWKTNSTGQENYIMQSANWYTVVYIPKNTYFTFDFRKNDESTITLDEAYNIYLTPKIDYASVSFINTYIKNIMKPAYWDGTNHTFPQSATRVSATEILFANDDIPIYIHDKSKLAFNIYYVDKDGTAISSTNYMNTDYVVPKGSYFVISLRNYSNNTITNVSELISYISFGKSEYFEKLFGTEMFIPNNININNEEAKIKFENTHYLRGNSEKRFSLLHFSDIHGDAETLRRIIKYRDYVASLLDDTICTGDLVNGIFSNDFNYWLNISDAKTILLTVGNHDSFTANSYNDSDLASMSDVATKFYAPLISNWNVTNYTANTTYYYKDYASKNIRLIVLDSQRIGTDATTQLTWLQNALTDAITNNYAVIIAMHYFPSQNIKQYDCSFSMYQYRTYNLSSEYVGFDVVGAVDTFIANGGEFITYLVGHKHADGFGYVENHNNQTVSIITCANPNKIGTGCDQSRNSNDKSADAFNLVTVDTARKYIQLVRVGATNTMFNLDRVSLCFNYSNKTFIKS